MTLSDRRILVIGAGGLGCPAVAGLAAAGVGHVTVVDPDVVDDTNLGRQMFFGDADVGLPKVAAVARAVSERFPSARIDAVQGRFERDDFSLARVRAHDLVLDGCDDFPTRFAANDLCVRAGVPLVHGAALGWRGQMLAVLPGESACLRCVFEGEPEGRQPTCAEAGVVAPLVGLVGGWMAEAAVQLLTGGRPSCVDALRIVDALGGRERHARVGRDPGCGACAAATS